MQAWRDEGNSGARGGTFSRPPLLAKVSLHDHLIIHPLPEGKARPENATCFFHCPQPAPATAASLAAASCAASNLMRSYRQSRQAEWVSTIRASVYVHTVVNS